MPLPSPDSHRLFIRRLFFLFSQEGVVAEIVEEEKADKTDEKKKEQPESGLDKIKQDPSQRKKEGDKSEEESRLYLGKSFF